MNTKVCVVYLGLSLVFKPVFGMMFLNSKKICQSVESEYSLRRVFLEGSFQIFTDLRQTRCAKIIPKTRLKTKETKVSFPSRSKGAFSVFLEYSLRNISGT
jgi:hypothetical protein